MADLAGYTAMTDVHGGASASKFGDKIYGDRQRIGQWQTKVMQRIGDLVVMIAEDSNDVLETSKKHCKSLLATPDQFLAERQEM